MSENTKCVREYTKFTINNRTKNWVEITEDSQQMYDANNDIKFKTSMIRSNLCDYSEL